MSKCYSELKLIDDYFERYKYLKCSGQPIGMDTFGSMRYLYQQVLQSYEWKKFKRDIIIRDNCCDMGFPGFEINSRPIIHHINPITIDDVKNKSSKIFDPENVIVVCHNTHLAIHYGDESLLRNAMPAVRFANDTKLW